ncbi:acyl dehydratase [Sulfitobacter aestuariivivens]|uniref:Acyl dehydratase n=1 Tax=Sulfitobacter aestuariivivens TaxID=2766981 RepID=A0A927D5W9_9RHOB|nr:acyl dehydratase [Sulfitobacter aestuariivivens]MBD3664409.1 acyl dehydratase [Sulfitobacter aestuariivivens]
MDQINFNAWIDRTETFSGAISEQTAKQIHTVLGKAASAPLADGSPLPSLWHWFAFPSAFPATDLHEDGNGQISELIPPMGQNRRVSTEGHLEFIQPLKVGETLGRSTQVANVERFGDGEKERFRISLDHQIHGDAGLCVLERQQIDYLPIPGDEPDIALQTVPCGLDIDEPYSLSTPLLFRYSALTFNAHRIHYDLPYAQNIEKYPDIVVQPQLQANLLMDLATRHRGSAPMFFSYRNLHPLFSRDALRLQVVRHAPEEWHLYSVVDDRHPCMQATAIWED